MKNHGNWRKEVPEWWPEDVDFRSPNVRNPVFIREELDSIIKSVQCHVRALAGEKLHAMETEANKDAEAKENGEEQAMAVAPNVDVAMKPMEETERTTGNVDIAAVATVDVAECGCKEFDVCSSNLHCYIFDKMPIPGEQNGLNSSSVEHAVAITTNSALALLSMLVVRRMENGNVAVSSGLRI